MRLLCSLTILACSIISSQTAQNITININDILTKRASIDLHSSNENLENRYCKICCINMQVAPIGKSCGTHTMCKYNERTTGPSCKGFVSIKLTRSEKLALVDAHNTLRNAVASGNESRGNPGPQPKAANMRAIQWNDELATIAERWAQQCIYNRDLCRDLEKFPVGQNIARGTMAINSELSLIYLWYDEVKHFDSSRVANYKIDKAKRNVATRYTQLIWADTYLIGCARVMFQFANGPKVSYREHLICNYGPTGNIPNQPVYKEGTPCSACQEGTSCSSDYPALCTSELYDEFYEYIENRTTNLQGWFNPIVLVTMFCLNKYFF